jgi:hypothetical protein
VSGDPLTAALSSGVAWVAGALGAHVVVFRMVRVTRRARTLVALFGAAALGHVATMWLAGLNAWRTAYGLAAIVSAFICYMPFYYTVSASQSVQMLLALARAPAGLPPDELRRIYAVDDVLAGRLDTLVGAGYPRRGDEGYALTAKGRLVAGSFRAIKTLWNLGPGG